ncbi:MAG: VOC family protein [Pseudonocardia sp.]|uniref:VOC family protein n=1 Tax=unclassified Pseudonocardia TaxID=2619320 RepID=UPI000869E155|nr:MULTISPECIES: VOC family protein [unclassified Pseudonocardia]MBN9109623.1 VOC family protein [Pseudonocardia sp.]ODU24651.1 MAG: glyoxalase [Pseudonocardia sp. SCN 72-51]ODV09058.1 MAG: glyoxalase [Pseudonocardia sp. SCN 73-27]
MATPWSLTIDCASPTTLAAFWSAALGYEPSPPPHGWATWDDWYDHHDVPVDERGDTAFLHDPAGAAPSLSFLRVPEAKTVKNRIHLDLAVGGGRHVDPDLRRSRIDAEVQRLTGLGATVLWDVPDHVTMTDPEGNEFDVL